MTEMVLDTSVLLDVLFEDRPRHAEATACLVRLSLLYSVALLPAHVLLELASAARVEKEQRGTPLRLASIAKRLPVNIALVTIDLDFVNRHIDWMTRARDVVRLKGSDTLFVALALQRRCPLVSNDRRMLKEARRLGIEAFATAPDRTAAT